MEITLQAFGSSDKGVTELMILKDQLLTTSIPITPNPVLASA